MRIIPSLEIKQRTKLRKAIDLRLAFVLVKKPENSKTKDAGPVG